MSTHQRAPRPSTARRGGTAAGMTQWKSWRYQHQHSVTCQTHSDKAVRTRSQVKKRVGHVTAQVMYDALTVETSRAAVVTGRRRSRRCHPGRAGSTSATLPTESGCAVHVHGAACAILQLPDRGLRRHVGDHGAVADPLATARGQPRAPVITHSYGRFARRDPSRYSPGSQRVVGERKTGVGRRRPLHEGG
jgi:hypothetical protein